jgi:anti-anti-sigma factor
MSDGSLRRSTAAGPGPQTVVVTLPAEIDVANGEQVRDALARARRGGGAIVVADATGTTFCDCAAVRALVRAHGEAAGAGTQLRVAAGPAVRRILELTGADHLLHTYFTVAAALSGGQSPADSNRDHQCLLSAIGGTPSP